MQEEGGNPMAPLLRAVNRIANAWADAQLLFDTLAYEYTVNPPPRRCRRPMSSSVCLAGCNSAERSRLSAAAASSAASRSSTGLRGAGFTCGSMPQTFSR